MIEGVSVWEFGLQSPLHHESYYGFAIDGDLDTDWTKCAISNFGEQADFLIDLRGIYPVNRIAVLSRQWYAEGAKVFAGNSSSANKDQIQSVPVRRLLNLVAPPLFGFNTYE